ncbi:MAG: tRNA lysidine(34) synthetase TilS, partial [Clostridia bacterium]|nr:tRNA lysidine(34) synthetase TilS [Clostridia bacterium]
MLTPNSKVLVALSGGADSVLMLRLLCRYREDFGLNIRAAHLNHCLRGDESLRDENFVKSLCDELNIPLEIKRVDIHAECKKSGEGCEECGRRIRYEFFNSIIDSDTLIATAHNLDDKVETLIMNIIRGTTLNGICSISPKRDNIIRPLIEISKNDILSYCKEMGYAYVTDSSNLTDIYRRNQIRHNILPYFKETNPSFDRSVSRMFESVETDNEFLLSLSKENFEKCKIGENIYSVDALKNLHPAILNRVLVLASNEADAHPEN